MYYLGLDWLGGLITSRPIRKEGYGTAPEGSIVEGALKADLTGNLAKNMMVGWETDQVVEGGAWTRDPSQFGNG